MKKIAAMALALTMCLTIASCGDTGSGGDGGETTKAAETSAKDDDKPEETEKPAETEAPEETEAAETTTEAPAEADNGDLTKEKYETMTKEDLLANIKDIENVTPEEMVWLISTFRFVDIVDEPDKTHDMYLAQSITKDALYDIKSKAMPDLGTYIDQLLDSEYPQVRGYAMSKMDSLFGVSDANIDRAKKQLETEEDPYVLYCAAVALSNSQAKDPAIHDFMMKMAESDNPKLRCKAAVSCGNSWSRGVDGCLEAVLKLMQDENDDVRMTALSYCGGLNEDAVIEPLKEVLMDPEQYKFHSSAMDGIADLWYDYPFMVDTNEEAYKVAEEYLKQTPRSENVPYFAAVSKYSNVADSAYDEWKSNSPYFDATKLCDMMEDIIKDGDCGWLTRCSAYNVIKAHDVERFKNLKSIIEGLDDAKADLVLEAYQKDLDKVLEKEG